MDRIVSDVDIRVAAAGFHHALAAAGTTEQIGSANAEQGPRFIEEEGDSGYLAKKKSILPIILIGVGVVAVAAVLFLVVLKTSYDIVGTWTETNTIWTEEHDHHLQRRQGIGHLEAGGITRYRHLHRRRQNRSFRIHMPPGTTTNGFSTANSTNKDKMSGTVQYLSNNVPSGRPAPGRPTRIGTTAGSGKLPMAKRSARKLQ